MIQDNLLNAGSTKFSENSGDYALLVHPMSIISFPKTHINLLPVRVYFDAFFQSPSAPKKNLPEMTTFPGFSAQDVNLLFTDTMFIAFAQSIERIVIPADGLGSRNPTVDTAFVRSWIKAETSRNHKPILLLHGFDSSMLEFRRLLPKLAID
jgi:hypothetical protein